MDLEKPYDRVPREELRYCGFKSGLAERYVRQLKDMYEDRQTVERCGSTNGYFQGGDRITTGINSDVELTILSQFSYYFHDNTIHCTALSYLSLLSKVLFLIYISIKKMFFHTFFLTVLD